MQQPPPPPVEPLWFYNQIPYKLWRTLNRKFSCSIMDQIFKHATRYRDFTFKTESSESFFRSRNSDKYHEMMPMERSIYILHLGMLEEAVKDASQDDIANKIRQTLALIKDCSSRNIIPQWSSSFVENAIGTASCFYVTLNIVNNAFATLSGTHIQNYESDMFFFSDFENSTAISNQRLPLQCQVSYILIHSSEDAYTVGSELGHEAPDGEFCFLPVFSAVRYGRPSAVLSLLQHNFAPRFGPTRSLYPCENECFLNLIFWAYDDALDSIRNSSLYSEPVKIWFTILTWIHDILAKNRLLVESVRDPSVAPADVQRIADSARMLWRAVPYTFVKPDDLYYTMRTETTILAYSLPDADELCRLYCTFFPDMITAPEAPRNLKHTCRCLIRETFRKKRLLPHIIWQLGLPDPVCRYLNLETD